MNVTGIILAGGKSSRMGEDKGLMLIEGIPMVEYIINVFKSLNIPILIISNNEKYQQFGLPVFPDLVHEKGPAGGIMTALSNTKTQTNFIVSCDTPFITKELILFLLKKHQNSQITYPVHENRAHPLIGVYEKDTDHFFQESIEVGELKLMSILKKAKTNRVNLPSSIFLNEKNCLANINTREELNTFKK